MKLTIIGGGSPYMTSMFTSLARYAKQGTFKNMDIVLTDTDEEAVKLMCEWGSAAAKNDNIPLNFSYEMDLNRSLEGADFVLSCIRTGGLECRYLDESIPLEFNQLGNETVGVGGVFYGLRTIPVVAQIAESIAKICPDAWLINYTNPTNMVTDASIRAGHEKTVGLCDGVFGAKWTVCRLLGIPTSRANEVDVSVAGVNHCTWSMELTYQGRDMYKELGGLIDKADLSGPAGFQNETESDLLDVIQADACRLYKYYGLLPGSVYYTPIYYGLQKLLDHLTSKPRTRAQWLQSIKDEKKEMISKQLADKDAHITAYDTEDSAHGDQAVGMLAMIADNTGERETVNVVNNGSIPNLPIDAIVETSCIVNSNSIIPVAHKPLPLAVEGVVRSSYAFAKLTVDAALTGDRNLVLQAVMANSSHRDLDIAEKMIEKMFEAHKQWLPQFKF